MTTSRRYIVAVHDDWTVAIEGPEGPILPAPARLWPAAGPDPPPGDTPTSKRFLYLLWQAGEATPLPTLYDKIFTFENYAREDIQELGRFLFGRLLGDAAWNALCADALAAGTGVIELALRFTDKRYELHRFPWELMVGPNGFLAHGAPGVPPASVTRLVQRPKAYPASPTVPNIDCTFHSPPRLLFVVGASLADRRIWPGAEIFGLLRQLDARGLTVRTRTLLTASTASLREAITEFEPDLVHFTCHGDIKEGDPDARGFLEFQREDRKGVIHRFASELAADLRAGKRTPPVVLLSACYSGATPPPAAAKPLAPPGDELIPSGDEGTPRTAGADRIGSLAAELVAGGVPVVIGMGGRVADSACRLFARYFGEALIGGSSLVAAVARGRQAAFLDGDDPDTVDWAFPVLFLDEQLPETHAPVDRTGPDPHRVLRNRIRHYGVPAHPVFCGRHEFFERYETLFRSTIEKPVLAIHTSSTDLGIGRSRLLKELAARALRDGHVPVLVSSPLPKWPQPPFPSAAHLAVEIVRAIDHACAAFDLPVPCRSATLGRILDANPHLELAAELAAATERYEFSSILDRLLGDITTSPSSGTLKLALQHDFNQVIKAARLHAPAELSAQGRVVLLLDDVDRYGAAIVPLCTALIGDFGLGSISEPVPVVLCYSLGRPDDQFLKEAHAKYRFLAKELAPFKAEGDEDMLAYGQVMLFPDPANSHARQTTDNLRASSGTIKIDSDIAGFTFNPRVAKEHAVRWRGKFRQRIGGSPLHMQSDIMYLTIEDAYDVEFLLIADDEARLAKLQELS